MKRIFSYLFMTSAVLCFLSAFGALIIFIRSIVKDIGIAETQTGFVFLYIFVITALLCPAFLFVSHRLEKYSGRMEEI